ncbi:hypothetical protein ACHWQZ_G004807 [Mnemiopsis leidyi]
MDKIFEEEERRIDLASIRKVDSNITHILDKQDNVAFYRFDGKAWHKQDIHGTIFVFSRSDPPFYGFTILNRKSLSDNVIELLIDGLEFQRCDLYLLYKTCTSGVSDTGIKSIWFEDDAGCIRISTLLHRLLRLRNESPTEGSQNILQMFEKSKDRVRQSESPDLTCSPASSPPYRHNKKRNNLSRTFHDDHDHRANNYRYDHDYRGNKSGEEGRVNNNTRNSHNIGHNAGHNAGLRSSHHGNVKGPQNRPHVKHQYNEKKSDGTCQGQKKQDKNLLSMFSEAHKRYSSSKQNDSETEVENRKSPDVIPIPQVSKAVTIMKRSNSEHPDSSRESNIVPDIHGLRKSRSTEAMTDAIKELSLAKEPLKEVKSMVPITFQDLVNSVQPTPNGRPLSCFSIEESSSSSAEEIALSSGDNEAESHSPRSSNSEPSLNPSFSHTPDSRPPLPNSRTTRIAQQLASSSSMADSAKLLMSPLDFQRVAVSKVSGAEVDKCATPAKRMLFAKKSKEGPTAKLDMDLTQFKEVLISAIEEDDKFAGMLFNVFQKKVIGNR